jgi:hypothetical protein
MKMNCKLPDQKYRPDLSDRHIILMVVATIVVAAIILLWVDLPAPGSAPGQLSAALGAVLLLAPLCFSMMKRSGLSASPPGWFVAHVISTLLGSCLIFIHVASGRWFTPPGLVLLLLVFLILQGSLLRAVFSRDFSLLFARSSAAQGFNFPASLDKSTLQRIIDQKSMLLQGFAPDEDEALFSPALKHWLRAPLSSFKYHRLAAREAAMVGARRSAGIKLSWSRRIHMIAGLLFYLGLLSHIVVMLFFAGYAAESGTIDWWYITDWGR